MPVRRAKRHRRYGSRIFHRRAAAAVPSRRLVTRLGVIKNARRSSEARARTFIIVRVVLRAPNETSARSYFILATLYNSDNYYMTSVSMNSGGRGEGWEGTRSRKGNRSRERRNEAIIHGISRYSCTVTLIFLPFSMQWNILKFIRCRQQREIRGTDEGILFE